MVIVVRVATQKLSKSKLSKFVITYIIFATCWRMSGSSKPQYTSAHIKVILNLGKLT